jgi:hypothetical protein
MYRSCFAGANFGGSCGTARGPFFRAASVKDTPPLAEPSVGAVRAIGAFVRLTGKPVRETAFTELRALRGAWHQ